jgi:hypothetical protein
MPLEDTESDLPGTIGVLVLLGEQAGDGRLREILQKVLQEQPASSVVTSLDLEESKMVNPMFAAARGVAEISWVGQNEPPYLL